MMYNYIFLIHFICYWLMVYFYDQNVNKNDHKIAIKSSLKNQFLITYPVLFIFFNYYPINYNNFYLSILSYPIIVLTGDIYFYLLHRPFHTKLLYKYHSHHHQGEVCVAKSLDADSLEHLICNIGSLLSGVVLLWYFNYIINIYVFSIWISIATINTCISHSNKKCFLDSGAHFNHHKFRNCNYGFGLYILDKILGTYN